MDGGALVQRLKSQNFVAILFVQAADDSLWEARITYLYNSDDWVWMDFEVLKQAKSVNFYCG